MDIFETTATTNCGTIRIKVCQYTRCVEIQGDVDHYPSLTVIMEYEKGKWNELGIYVKGGTSLSHAELEKAFWPFYTPMRELWNSTSIAHLKARAVKYALECGIRVLRQTIGDDEQNLIALPEKIKRNKQELMRLVNESALIYYTEPRT